MVRRTLVLALAVGTAACDPTPPSPPPTLSSDAEPLLRIERFEGMMRRADVFRHLPDAIVYANGVVISQGPVDASFPGPALPNLVLTQLNDAGLGEIFDWVRQAQLHGRDRELGRAIPDGGVTIFTVTTNGQTHTTKLHSQGMDGQIAALRQLRDALADPAAALPEGTFTGPSMYEFDRLAVLIVPPVMRDDHAAPPELRGLIEWPLRPLAELAAPHDPREDYACFLVDGADLAELRPLIEQANELTLWASGGIRYELAFRPLLPDEDACPRY